MDNGILKCEQNLVTFASGGNIYALNGRARGQAEGRGWKEIDLIWKDNPEMAGTKINIGPLIDLGLALCH